MHRNQKLDKIKQFFKNPIIIIVYKKKLNASIFQAQAYLGVKNINVDSIFLVSHPHNKLFPPPNATLVSVECWKRGENRRVKRLRGASNIYILCFHPIRRARQIAYLALNKGLRLAFDASIAHQVIRPTNKRSTSLRHAPWGGKEKFESDL